MKKKEKIPIGEPVSDFDNFYLDWCRETIKNNISLSNDILKQLITLNTALLGVNIIFESIVFNHLLKFLILIFFFLSLIIALLGVLPYQNRIVPFSPDDIKNHKDEALRHKLKYLWTSATFLIIGFGIVLGELYVRLLL